MFFHTHISQVSSKKKTLDMCSLPTYCFCRAWVSSLKENEIYVYNDGCVLSNISYVPGIIENTLFIYLFIWLHQVLIEAHESLVVVCGILLPNTGRIEC